MFLRWSRQETRMPYERKALGRLAIVFGIAAVSYGIAGFVATQARDQLMARLEMRQETQGQLDGLRLGTRSAARKANSESTGSIE